MIKPRTVIGLALVVVSLFLIPYTQSGAAMFGAAGIALSLYNIVRS